MQTGRRALWTVLLAASTAAAPHAASAAERVQLASFLVPAMKSQYPHSELAAITVFVEVRDVKEGEYVCALSPRVREAVTKMAYRKPLPRKTDGTLDMTTISSAISGLVRQNVKPVAPSQITVVEGTQDVTAVSALAQKFRAKACVVRTDLDKKKRGKAGH